MGLSFNDGCIGILFICQRILTFWLGVPQTVSTDEEVKSINQHTDAQCAFGI